MTPDELLAALSERYPYTLTDGGPCPGGEVGARYANGPDGRAYVYKWIDGPADMVWATALIDRITRLRSNGYPAPRYLEPFDLGTALVLVQESVAGSWSDAVDHELVRRMLSVNDRQAGLGQSGSEWSDYIAMTLTEGANGYCLHRSLREQGGEVADILGWVQAVGRAIGPLPQADLVHLDFHHRNLLRTADGGLTVVDMEGCQPGDRAFDLVTFCFGMSHAEAPVGVEEPLWLRAIELTSSENVRAYVAHMALRLLDWTIRLHPAPELHRLLPVVRRFIDRVQDS